MLQFKMKDAEYNIIGKASLQTKLLKRIAIMFVFLLFIGLSSNKLTAYNNAYLTINQHAVCGCTGSVTFYVDVINKNWCGFCFSNELSLLLEHKQQDGSWTKVHEEFYNISDVNNKHFTTTIDGLCPGDYNIGIVRMLIYGIDGVPGDSPFTTPYYIEFTINDVRDALDADVTLTGAACIDRMVNFSFSGGEPPYKVKKCGTNDWFTTSDNILSLDAEQFVNEDGTSNVCFYIEDSNDPPCYVEKKINIPLLQISVSSNIPSCFADPNTSGKVSLDYVSRDGGRQWPPINIDEFDVYWYDEDDNLIAQDQKSVDGLPTNKNYKCVVVMKDAPYCTATTTKFITQKPTFQYSWEKTDACLDWGGKAGSVTIYYSSVDELTIKQTEGVSSSIGGNSDDGHRTGYWIINGLAPGEYCFQLTTFLNPLYTEWCADTLCVTIEGISAEKNVAIEEIIQPSPCDKDSKGCVKFYVKGNADNFEINASDKNPITDAPTVTITDEGTPEETHYYEICNLEGGNYYYIVDFDEPCPGWAPIDFTINETSDLATSIEKMNAGDIFGKIKGNVPPLKWTFEVFDCSDFKNENYSNPKETKSGTIEEVTNEFMNVVEYKDTKDCECCRITVVDGLGCESTQYICDGNLPIEVEVALHPVRDYLYLKVYRSQDTPPESPINIDKIVIYDLNMLRLKEIAIENNQLPFTCNINISDLASGVYFVNAIDNAGEVVSHPVQFIKAGGH